jgi:hypothetical protein
MEILDKYQQLRYKIIYVVDGSSLKEKGGIYKVN